MSLTICCQWNALPQFHWLKQHWQQVLINDYQSKRDLHLDSTFPPLSLAPTFNWEVMEVFDIVVMEETNQFEHWPLTNVHSWDHSCELPLEPLQDQQILPQIWCSKLFTIFQIWPDQMQSLWVDGNEELKLQSDSATTLWLDYGVDLRIRLEGLYPNLCVSMFSKPSL